FGAALYAALPLPVFESAGMGHLDSAGVALLLAALLHLRRRRPAVAGAGFALSVMTKYFAGFAALTLARRGRLRFAGAAIAVASAVWAAGAGGGASPGAGLSNFA